MFTRRRRCDRCGCSRDCRTDVEAKHGSCQRFAAIDSSEFCGARGRLRLPVHTFDPQHFPFSPARPYTPEPVSVEELRSLHKALHISRVIVVQTTVYGTDNAGVLDAMNNSARVARGVAVIDRETPDSALDEWIAPEFAASG